MNIYTADLLREWDAFTEAHEPIASVELMERAANACAEWIQRNIKARRITVLCGTGNNGGDGMAIARMLKTSYHVKVMICGDPGKGSQDFKTNLHRFQALPDAEWVQLKEGEMPGEPEPGEVLIDALFGTGINRPVDGWLAGLIETLNSYNACILSIDLPSGLLPDLIGVQQGAIIRARHTLTFQCPKLSFCFIENYCYTGTIHILDIGLSEIFAASKPVAAHVLSETEFCKLVPVKEKTGHKNQFGHVQVIAGSKGKMGAAVLCARAVLRTGAGLVTACIPKCGYPIMQTAFPEAMCIEDEGNEALVSTVPLPGCNAIALGPGIGTAPETALLLRRLLQEVNLPLVIDADALNLMASREMPSKLPKGAVLTPHPKEFDRLFGQHSDTFSRYQTQVEMAVAHGVVIVLKGAYTSIALPDGSSWFNFTGNSGMATAGSGDVLTGIIAGLLARGLRPEDAAVAGVYLHGRAGDEAMGVHKKETLIASDLIEHIPEALASIRSQIALR